MIQDDTIIALATPSGVGAIGVIRISGKKAISVADKIFSSVVNRSLYNQKTHSVLLGHINDGDRIIDEVLLSLFKGPKSYTGEDVIEISCHGSHYIQSEIIQLFIRNGCRSANPGEFTFRAFLNGKMDLIQAESVADLIASDSESSHKIALQQMRGGFSSKIKGLREELINFASLIELELDFSDEDVDFADLKKFQLLLDRISSVLKYLIESFAAGSVIKQGVPISIVGEPNVGKSTLLNFLLNDEKAIVSDIAGTTLDAIEDELIIDGVKFRFIDTAGIRQTDDEVESIGIKKTFKKIADSQVVLFMIDSSKSFDDNLSSQVSYVHEISEKNPKIQIIIVYNKVDLIDNFDFNKAFKNFEYVKLSAKTGNGIDILKKKIICLVQTGKIKNNDTIITNARHYEALIKANDCINNVKDGLKNEISSDLLAIDIRQAIYHFGQITGEISSDDLLGNIFSKFCIGK